MKPLKELKELAHALTQTTEYAEMIRYRKKVMENTVLGRQMLAFEREHARLENLNLPAADTSARLKKLYEGCKDFFENADIQNLLAATQRYQRMISDCITYLNRFLDVNNGGKSY
jgi:cell fate (sporulation/competence/biofilm development) regulator YlbF (YheA/YmcA/DUF963 family)